MFSDASADFERLRRVDFVPGSSRVGTGTWYGTGTRGLERIACCHVPVMSSPKIASSLGTPSRTTYL